MIEPKNLSARIESILDAQFVKTTDVSRILAQGIAGGRNVLLYGAAGHGKSEMVCAALKGLDVTPFVQFFGEGMDEARLYGGLDYARLERDKVIEYNTDRSFLPHEIAVFEEMLDAPPKVLMALKDTLTAGELRNGAQRVPMDTRCIVCLTNLEPRKIVELGPAAQALIERFPLRYHMIWPDYRAIDFESMLKKVDPRILPKLDGTVAIGPLAELIAEAISGGAQISPRTAVHALAVVKTSAMMRGSEEIIASDFDDLKYIPELAIDLGALQKLLQRHRERLAAKYALEETSRKLAAAAPKFEGLVAIEDAGERERALALYAEGINKIRVALSKLSVPDDMLSSRDKLLETSHSLLTKAGFEV